MKCHVSRLYGCLVLVCCLWTCFRLYQDPFASCPTNNERDICFVTCIFGNSIEEVDHPANVKWFETRWCHTEFWLVTNLADLPAPGWTKILFDTDPRLSHIVQSRHAKFLGWKVLQPQVQSCKAVIYMDGYLQPKASLSRFQKIAKDVQTSHWGLAQVEQPYYRGSTMESILNQLVVDRKDTKEHVQGTLEWFQQQDDYQDVMTYYLNKYFGKEGYHFALIAKSGNQTNRCIPLFFCFVLAHSLQSQKSQLSRIIHVFLGTLYDLRGIMERPTSLVLRNSSF